MNRFGMEDCKTVSTPVDIHLKLNKPNREADDEILKLPYRELITLLCT